MKTAQTVELKIKHILKIIEKIILALALVFMFLSGLAYNEWKELKGKVEELKSEIIKTQRAMPFYNPD